MASPCLVQQPGCRSSLTVKQSAFETCQSTVCSSRPDSAVASLSCIRLNFVCWKSNAWVDEISQTVFLCDEGARYEIAVSNT